MNNLDSSRFENNDFLQAVQDSFSILLKLNGRQGFLLSLSDGHYFFDGTRIVASSDHNYRCYNLPISSFELQLVIDESIQRFESLATYVIAHVAIMATGGVEWNTMAILKNIGRNSLISSVVKPDSTQGDMNRIALELGIPIYCGFDCRGNPLEVSLDDLIEVICPKVFWICNWSLVDQANSLKTKTNKSSTRIVDQRAYDNKQGWIQTINREMAVKIDSFVATNEPIADEIRKRIGNSQSNKISIIRPVLREIPNFVLRPPSTVNIFQICRLTEQKRIDRGIKIHSHSRNHGFLDSWNIVGNGPLLTDLRNSSILTEGLNFLGFKRTFEVFENVTGVVQTSDYEGLPMSVIEALAAGLPVFATATGDLPWLREQIFDSDCELLTLTVFDCEETMLNNYLDWRCSLNQIWKSNSRYSVSMKIRNLFDVEKAAVSYSSIFESGSAK
jgi:glycosyltransferase involved in cell wall biosynthesis